MRVLADLHGGDLDDIIAKAEFQEIKERVMFDVGSLLSACGVCYADDRVKRESGEGRSYTVMWKRYKRRVLLAMSSQAFAQLVSCLSYFTPLVSLTLSSRTASMVSVNRERYHLVLTISHFAVISYYARECYLFNISLMVLRLVGPQLEYLKVSLVDGKCNRQVTQAHSEAGWVGRDAILMTGINAIIYILSTLPPYVTHYMRQQFQLYNTQVVSCRPVGKESYFVVRRRHRT